MADSTQVEVRPGTDPADSQNLIEPGTNDSTHSQDPAGSGLDSDDFIVTGRPGTALADSQDIGEPGTDDSIDFQDPLEPVIDPPDCN